MNVIGFIFARGGSKGVFRKNLRMLAGKPLLAWSIDAARQCPEVGRVIVSTEDSEIAETARHYGAEVPFMRPQELAGDRSPEWLAWQHAVREVHAQSGPFDVFLSVPATAPLRHATDLSRAIELLRGGDCDAVISVTPASHNPYFNMVRMADDGHVAIVAAPDAPIAHRQSAPVLFDITSVAYAVRPEYILAGASLMTGRIKGVVIPKERAIDIDDEIDLRFAEFMIHDMQQQ